MKKEPFRSLLVTSLIYVVFFGILILNELDIRLFPPRDTDPIELAFQLSGTSDNPDAVMPKEPEIKPLSSSGSQEIITTSDPSDFNAALVNKVDTSQNKNDSIKGNSSGNSGESAGASVNTFGNGTGDGYIYDVSMVSDMPKFLGGDINSFRRWVIDNINSSSYNVKSTDKGTLLITFIIDEEGNLTNVALKKGVSEELDKEVVRIFNTSPQWEPGKQQGHPVKILYSMPIHFAN
jgi:hypothetical protein